MSALDMVDGRSLGTTPLTVDDLAVGKTVRLRLTLATYDPWEREEPITAGGRMNVIAQLKEIRGRLMVESHPPGAEVFLNNRSLGLTPLDRDDLDPFTDGTIEVRKQGYKPKRQPLTWAGQRAATLTFDLEVGR